MSDLLVCPDCGSDSFTQTRTTRTEFTVSLDVNGHMVDRDDGVCMDSGERDEDGIECQDCGASYDCDTDELITVEAYNADDDDER